MSKRCEFCGRFMALTDVLPMDDDEFDYELAGQHGFCEDFDSPFDDQWARFHYVQDQWECDNCQTQEWHVEGKRYYYRADVNNYVEGTPQHTAHDAPTFTGGGE